METTTASNIDKDDNRLFVCCYWPFSMTINPPDQKKRFPFRSGFHLIKIFVVVVVHLLLLLLLIIHQIIVVVCLFNVWHFLSELCILKKKKRKYQSEFWGFFFHFQKISFPMDLIDDKHHWNRMEFCFF